MNMEQYTETEFSIIFNDVRTITRKIGDSIEKCIFCYTISDNFSIVKQNRKKPIRIYRENVRV
ncbi:MAG: hypothetical protein C4527_08720 [Candidatus Omnitrophota bacterium]|nr:MAG: hypothetical protein C4527_08720 [Candidatus Omnitrophota bacterium]